MPDSDDLLGTVIEVAHWFEVDLRTVVVVNHQLTMDGIASFEQREIAQMRERFAAEDVLDSMVGFQEWFCSDLRKAAHELAVVGVVTRFQHWIQKFVHQLGTKPTQSHDSALVSQLEALNNRLGVGPVPVAFFDELVTVRDSVIHADSKAQWHYKKARTVANRYSNGRELALTEDHLNDAIAKAIEQVKWYDERLAARRPGSSLPSDTSSSHT